MVSKPVTSRSIWRLALLISAAACSPQARTPAPAAAGKTADLVLVHADVFTPSGHKPSVAVRGLTFFDSAYTTFINTKENEKDGTRSYLISGKTAEVRGLAPFKNSIGVGTRFYLRQIVLPLLGLDFGYGLEARDFQVYLAIGLTD